MKIDDHSLNIEKINWKSYDATYVAFTAIRWGFAIINKEGKLEETDIWRHKDLHDGRGKLIDQPETKSNSDFANLVHLILTDKTVNLLNYRLTDYFCVSPNYCFSHIHIYL